MNELQQKITEWKRKRDAVILAHYYVADEVQAIADYVGDSYYLAKVAASVPQKTLLFCGVSFMGESAKLLNPDKTVLLPDASADCPMAHMANKNRIEALRNEYDDLAVVCYINSTAELKMYSDVCVTSSNALTIVSALPNKHIYFIPDENLGRYIASLVPDKHFIFNDGFCHVHKNITKNMLQASMDKHKNAKVLVHPECTMDVLECADYIGSTSGIIDYATNSDASEFIICTEQGIRYELNQKNKEKQFYFAAKEQSCPDMKKITLEKVLHSLETEHTKVELDPAIAKKASNALVKMLELSK